MAIGKGQRVLITGASSGIGAEFARQLAAKGADLILTARREDRLEALAALLRERHVIDVQVIPCDLGTAEGPGQLYEVATGEGRPPVDVLINNAGYGLYGPLLDADLGRTLQMLQLNMTSAVELAWRFGRHMREHGRESHILNVASAMGFQAVPGMAAYGATKAFLRDVSEGMSLELAGTNVRVTVLHPGATRTEFVAEAGLGGAQGIIERLGFQDTAEVVRCGLRATEGGRVSVVSGWLNKLNTFLVRLVPRRLASLLAERAVGAAA